LPSDKLCYHRLQPAYEHSGRNARTQTHLSRDEQHQRLLTQTPAARRLVVDPKPSLRGTHGSRNPGIKQSGLFFDWPRLNLSALPLATESLRRQPVEETGDDEFHDSESEDVYDLFNACNGVLHKGRLDIRKLDEYSPEEAEALNVPRLKEIWDHTELGCSECEEIIRTLNLIRGTLREDAEELFEVQAEAVDVNVIDSIS
jgi:hypothetical protein